MSLLNAFEWKFSCAVFYRGLLTAYAPFKTTIRNRTRKVVPELVDTIIVARDLFIMFIVAIWPLICFILFFFGLFCFEAQLDPFTIFYMEMVILSSVGYGDVVFKDAVDRAIQLTLITLAIAYIPNALTKIVKDL